MILLPEEEQKVKKRNRIKRLSPKKHKIVHESGRSTKNLWRMISARAKAVKKEQNKNLKLINIHAWNFR